MDPRPEPTHRTLKSAVVRWDGARPVSVAYDDIYHDIDGAGEAVRVFLAPAKLEERFAASTGTFTIAELGFGSALNFAVAAERFLEKSSGRLHYISFEHAPMAAQDLARAAKHSGLGVHRQLSDAYPPLISGWHRRHFAAGRVQLSLYLGDARAGLADLEGRLPRGVDAWFLDGFAPTRNPEMWQSEVCAAVAGLSRPATTVTTFSAAGVIKRALNHAGFEVTRIDQRPHKRHSVLGVVAGEHEDLPALPATVSVLGAGFAGCATAHALAQRGIAVTVHDTAVAAGASSIPAAVLHARLLTDGSAAASFRAHSYAFATYFYRGRGGLRPTGALQLPGANTSAKRIEAMQRSLPADWVAAVSSRQASSLAGLDIHVSGLHFPHAAMIDGPALCRSLLDHPDIRVDPGAPTGDITVYACGAAITDFVPELEVTALIGQADRFASKPLHIPVLGDGYFAPAGDSCWVGSTYEYRPWKTSDATAANAERFRDLFSRSPARPIDVFRGARAVTSDRTPIVGRLDANTYVSVGHGSNGTTSAALAAEWIASLIAQECPPVTRAIETLCRAERFRERQLRRPNPFARY